MGVSRTLARAAARHAHVLVVEVPGSWRTRATVERQALMRGWHLAASPADADVLVVCGEPGAGLARAVELVWAAMPGPRVRVVVGAAEETGGRLDEAYAALIDSERHRVDARCRAVVSELLDGGGHEDMDRGGGHEGMDHGGGHEGMDHGGGHEDMEMSPDGIPLAESGEDRDGLEMDVLHVRLGPVLRYWPAGLVLRCALQGDVIVEADAEMLDHAGPLQDADGPAPARSCDDIAALLALAGWADAAAAARALRDDLLAQAEVEGDGYGKTAAAARLWRLHRKVSRSRLLRWSLRGVGPLTGADLDRHGLAADAAGDTYDRLVGMLERTHAELTGDHGPAQPAPAPVSAAQLPSLVTGLDLAAARLVVASLGVHGRPVRPVPEEMQHG